MFKYKPDYEETIQRYEAWWDGADDRLALVYATAPKPENERAAYPDKQHASHRERWLDVEFQADRAAARMANTLFLGDAIPTVWPNLGPDFFAALYGCELEFGESTSWSIPNLHDWADSDKIRIDLDHFYLHKLEAIEAAMLERARGKFIVGYTDIHAGGDAVAAFRDPQTLCVDMLTDKENVKALLDRVTDDFLELYDRFHNRLSAEGMPSACWLPLVSEKKYHVPSNDFSCLVSADDFREVFLPGIVRECQHMDRNIYHLDGPDALRHLEALLEVPEIQGIQWVFGAGQGPWQKWIDVYKRIQQSGKRNWIYTVYPQDLDELFEALEPTGVAIHMAGLENEADARQAVERVRQWR